MPKEGISFKIEPKAKDEKGIATVLETYFEALKNNDIDALAKTLSDSARFHFLLPNGRIGRQTKQRFLTMLKPGLRIKPLGLENLEIKIDDKKIDIALAQGDSWHYHDDKLEGPEKVLFGFRKENGFWKILLYQRRI